MTDDRTPKFDYVPWTMPDYCVRCGVPLAGSWTKHTRACPIGKLIRDTEQHLRDIEKDLASKKAP